MLYFISSQDEVAGYSSLKAFALVPDDWFIGPFFLDHFQNVGFLLRTPLDFCLFIFHKEFFFNHDFILNRHLYLPILFPIFFLVL